MKIAAKRRHRARRHDNVYLQQTAQGWWIFKNPIRYSIYLDKSFCFSAAVGGHNVYEYQDLSENFNHWISAYKWMLKYQKNEILDIEGYSYKERYDNLDIDLRGASTPAFLLD